MLLPSFFTLLCHDVVEKLFIRKLSNVKHLDPESKVYKLKVIKLEPP